MRLLGVAMVIAVGWLALGRGTAHTQMLAVRVPMEITEDRISGATGDVTFTRMPGDMLRVQIRITGLNPNAEHAAHIHGSANARCDNGAPITHPLNNIIVDADGLGMSDTTVMFRSMATSYYVNVHTAANPPGPGVICANMPGSIQFGMPAALPATGDGSLADEDDAGTEAVEVDEPAAEE